MSDDDASAFGRVYMLTNTVTGKVYVGQTTTSLKRRFRVHVSTSKHHPERMPVAAAIAKYGKENFTIEQLAVCHSLDELNACEYRLAMEKSAFAPHGYNLRAGSGPGTMSDETKRKISAANIGKKASDATRLKLSESHKGFIPTPETCARRAAALKGVRPGALAQKNCLLAVTKVYTVYAPDGNPVTFRNMQQHCRTHNLSAACMYLVVKGVYKQHKGWTARPANKLSNETKGEGQHMSTKPTVSVTLDIFPRKVTITVKKDDETSSYSMTKDSPGMWKGDRKAAVIRAEIESLLPDCDQEEIESTLDDIQSRGLDLHGLIMEDTGLDEEEDDDDDN